MHCVRCSVSFQVCLLLRVRTLSSWWCKFSGANSFSAKTMHQNNAVIVQQFIYSKNSFIVLVPGLFKVPHLLKEFRQVQKLDWAYYLLSREALQVLKLPKGVRQVDVADHAHCRQASLCTIFVCGRRPKTLWITWVVVCGQRPEILWITWVVVVVCGQRPETLGITWVVVLVFVVLVIVVLVLVLVIVVLPIVVLPIVVLPIVVLPIVVLPIVVLVLGFFIW